MRVTHVRIHNYRSIHDVALDTSELMVLLGPNNHGKSNILRAIEFSLSTSAKVERDDFFAFRDDNDQELWVEVTFAGLTEQERRTFTKYVRSDGSVKIRKAARITSSDIVEVSYHGYLQEPTEWWLQSTAFERLDNRDKVAAEADSVPQLSILLQGTGRITKQQIQDFQCNYIQEHGTDLTFTETLEDGPLLGTKNVAGGILPDFYLVPALRDVCEETKVKSTTVFGRLLQHAIQEMAEYDVRFIDLRDRMSRLINELNARPDVLEEERSQLARLELAIGNELRAWGVNVSIEVAPPEIEKLFELGTQLQLDDGLKTPAQRKGHGLQRAVLFALLRAWAKALRTTVREGTAAPRRASESVIFAIEEPELFLHPHAQRQLAKALHDIASPPEHQVFVSSHSTHFVDLDHYRSIAIVSKECATKATVIRQCTQDLFEGEDAHDKKSRFHMAAWVNPDRGELFFARKVVLVEGETEKALLPFLANKLDCFDPDVSIIDCGSKHNLHLYIAILNAFSLSYVVIHDEDPVPEPMPSDWTDEKKREKHRTYSLNYTIAKLVDGELGVVHVLSPDFEGAAGVSRSQGEKNGKALAALNHFASKSEEDIPDPIRRLVRAVFSDGNGGAVA
jgi:putative ATP-dependent endonuclease of OLD family